MKNDVVYLVGEPNLSERINVYESRELAERECNDHNRAFPQEPMSVTELNVL